MKTQEGENNVQHRDAEPAPAQRNKDFTVNVESQRADTSNGHLTLNGRTDW